MRPTNNSTSDGRTELSHTPTSEFKSLAEEPLLPSLFLLVPDPTSPSEDSPLTPRVASSESLPTMLQELALLTNKPSIPKKIKIEKMK
jgi:hypothetical protein